MTVFANGAGKELLKSVLALHSSPVTLKFGTCPPSAVVAGTGRTHGALVLPSTGHCEGSPGWGTVPDFSHMTTGYLH